MSNINVPNGPLIPGDGYFSSGTFTKNLKVENVLSAYALKSNVVIKDLSTIVSLNNATTLTAANLLETLIVTADGPYNVTLPSASVIVTSLKSWGLYPENGSTLQFTVSNNADGTITLVSGTGGSLYASYTVPVSVSKTFLLRLSDISTSPTYVVYQS